MSVLLLCTTCPVIHSLIIIIHHNSMQEAGCVLYLQSQQNKCDDITVRHGSSPPRMLPTCHWTSVNSLGHDVGIHTHISQHVHMRLRRTQTKRNTPKWPFYFSTRTYEVCVSWCELGFCLTPDRVGLFNLTKIEINKLVFYLNKQEELLLFLVPVRTHYPDIIFPLSSNILDTRLIILLCNYYPKANLWFDKKNKNK